MTNKEVENLLLYIFHNKHHKLNLNGTTYIFVILVIILAVTLVSRSITNQTMKYYVIVQWH